MAAATSKNRKKDGAGALARALPALTVVLAVAYAIAAYFLLYLPKLDDIAPGGAEDTSAVTARIADDNAYLARIQGAETSLKNVNPVHKKRVEAMIPLDADVPGIFVQMDALASANNLVLVSVNSVVDAKTETDAGVETVRIAVNLAGGSYSQFKGFLADAQHLLRVTDVRNVTFTPGSGTYSAVLSAYFLDTQKLFGTAPAAKTP